MKYAVLLVVMLLGCTEQQRQELQKLTEQEAAKQAERKRYLATCIPFREERIPSNMAPSIGFDGKVHFTFIPGSKIVCKRCEDGMELCE